jgi:hypothetical protein
VHTHQATYRYRIRKRIIKPPTSCITHTPSVSEIFSIDIIDPREYSCAAMPLAL